MIEKIKTILNKFVRRTYWFNNIAFPDCQKFWYHNTFDIDLVNLGSSSARSAFFYASAKLKACNWAMAPQSFVGDYEILRNYSCYLRDGATVIIPICPFSCLGGANYDLPDKYYTVLNIASMPHASFVRQQQQMALRNNPLSAFPLIELCSRHKTSKTYDFDADASMRMNSWKREFSIMDWSYPLSIVNKDAYNDSAELLGQIVKYCLTHSFLPVIVMPPVADELLTLFTPAMKSLFITDFVKKATSDAMFLNYMEDGEFREKNYYTNSFLLNESGSRKFTTRVLQDLNLL